MSGTPLDLFRSSGKQGLFPFGCNLLWHPNSQRKAGSRCCLYVRTLRLQEAKSGTLLHTGDITASADISDIPGERRLGTHRLSGLLMRQGSPRFHPALPA